MLAARRWIRGLRGAHPPIPGVFVRVAGKGLTRQGVCKSGKQRTYKEAFLRFGATEEFPKGKEVGDLGGDRGDHGEG
jgi:hypothetical protein